METRELADPDRVMHENYLAYSRGQKWINECDLADDDPALEQAYSTTSLLFTAIVRTESKSRIGLMVKARVLADSMGIKQEWWWQRHDELTDVQRIALSLINDVMNGRGFRDADG